MVTGCRVNSGVVSQLNQAMFLASASQEGACLQTVLNLVTRFPELVNHVYPVLNLSPAELAKELGDQRGLELCKLFGGNIRAKHERGKIQPQTGLRSRS